MKTAEELINSDSLIVVDGEYTDDTIKQAFSEGIDWGYKEAMRWRDVNEELPDDAGLYLCKCKSNRLGFYYEIVFFNKAWRSDNVIGWKPIE